MEELANRYFEEFKNCLWEYGIKKGDVVYVSSDVKPFLWYVGREFGIKKRSEQFLLLDKLIDSIQEVVGVEGTLLFPNYTWSFCRGEVFDYKKTQGEIGILGNYILNNRSDFYRTQHPIYGFMVWGKDALYLRNLPNQDSWGDASPFAYLHRKNAKQLNLGVSMSNCLTFLHYVEQCINVPYRYKKYFMSNYIDEYGVEEVRVYSMYVRDTGIDSYVTLPQEYFCKEKVISQEVFKGWEITFMELEDVYEAIEDDLRNKQGEHIYHFDNYKINWNVKQTHCDEIKVFAKSLFEVER